jgi:hypothetical protein
VRAREGEGPFVGSGRSGQAGVPQRGPRLQGVVAVSVEVDLLLCLKA